MECAGDQYGDAKQIQHKNENHVRLIDEKPAEQVLYRQRINDGGIEKQRPQKQQWVEDVRGPAVSDYRPNDQDQPGQTDEQFKRAHVRRSPFHGANPQGGGNSERSTYCGPCVGSSMCERYAASVKGDRYSRYFQQSVIALNAYQMVRMAHSTLRQ